MLDECAPGYTHRIKPHNIWVTFNGRTYPALPRGKKGDTNPEIQVGHIKQMIRFLGIDMECAQGVLKILK
jgi:hypothetical protein